MKKWVGVAVLCLAAAILIAALSPRTEMHWDSTPDQEKRIADHMGALLQDSENIVLGNPNGDVTVVEFFDYRCPSCIIASTSLFQLLERDPNVRVIMKEYPVFGHDSANAAMIATGAAQLGRYADAHRILMATHGPITQATVAAVAQRLGVDATALEQASLSRRSKDYILRNLDLGPAVGIKGTPSFIIGPHLLLGAASLDRLLAAVAAARAEQRH
jgi:protein-disulfide isomerase